MFYAELDISEFSSSSKTLLKTNFNIKDVYYFEALGIEEHYVAIALISDEVVEFSKWTREYGAPPRWCPKGSHIRFPSGQMMLFEELFKIESGVEHV